ncbi:MAG: hypothetical protein ABR949_10290 [Candidatus Aquilonibacter sp.]|jgi:hypothetical protein
MSAVDQSAYIPAPQALPAPAPTQQVAMAPPVGFPPPVPPAVAARKRKDEKKDVATKVGRKVLNATQNQGPTPPANPLATPLPAAPVQKAAVESAPLGPDGKPLPAPQERNVDFKPAQYKPPNKGLEYAALALTLLAPGTKIAQAAAQFVGGLNKGSEEAYQRNEQQAEQKYKVDQANAENEYKNAVARYGAASDEAHRAFVNQQSVNGADFATAEAAWQAKVAGIRQKQELWTQGLMIGPKGNAIPVPLPPALAKPLGPNATPQASFQRQNAIADFYAKNGITGAPAQRADRLAQTYQSFMIDQYNQGREDARHADTENREDTRQARTFAHEEYLRRLEDPTKKNQAMSAAFAARNDYYNFMADSTKPKFDKDGNKIAGPDMSADDKAAVQPYINKILRDPDPMGMSKHYAETSSLTEAQKQAINLAGQYGYAQRYATDPRSIKPRSEAYYDAVDRSNAAAAAKRADATLAKSGLNLRDPQVAAEIKKFKDAGVPIDADAIAAIKKDLKDLAGQRGTAAFNASGVGESQVGF